MLRRQRANQVYVDMVEPAIWRLEQANGDLCGPELWQVDTPGFCKSSVECPC